MSNICVVGLGYVGLTLAVYLARQGLQVHGVEISNEILQSLKRKKAHFYEDHFDIHLEKAIDNGLFTYGDQYTESPEKTVYIITVGTPLGTDGLVHLTSLQTVIDNIAKELKDDDIIVLRSTVKLGTTQGMIKEALGKTGKTYYLGFCPERTLEGSAFKELSSLPQIISGINDDSLKEIEMFFKSIFRETVAMKSVEEAEMVKLLNNSERDLMFAVGNEVALMCEEKGLDAYRIIQAANYQYPRSNLKKPGPVGGPCLEKDPYILTEGFKKASYQPSLFTAGRKVNESIIRGGLKRFLERKEVQGSIVPTKVAVLGFAFKGIPSTGDVRGSLVCDVVNTIKNYFPYAKIIGHDYLATSYDMRRAGALEGLNDLKSVLKDADMVILQNNHPFYKREDWANLQQLMGKGAWIYDFWNQLEGVEFLDGRFYHVFGRGKV